VALTRPSQRIQGPSNHHDLPGRTAEEAFPRTRWWNDARETPCQREARSATLKTSEGAVTDWREHLTSDLKVCGGQLCAKGTQAERVPCTTAERVLASVHASN